jgi:hypothetical protein
MRMALLERAAERSPLMEQLPLADDLRERAWAQAHGQGSLVDADAGPGPRRADVLGGKQLALHPWSINRSGILRI